ncbi:MAG: DUF6134 family protein [Magnetovibrio sp.]|nr:DUF6134 family protein [Magnetovibrio sp.]
MKCKIFIIFALSVLFVTFSSMAFSGPETLNFQVLRNGKPVGTHRITISNIKNQIRVDLHTQIKIDGFFTTSYAFDHTSQETWAGGQLLDMTSITDNDGNHMSVIAHPEEDSLIINSVINGRDRLQILPLGIMPTSLWNADLIGRTQLLNSQDGKILDVSVKNLGTENIPVHGILTQTHHYGISGEFTRELWFDEDGKLVKVEFPDKSKTTITFILK